jgi:eukaryotic-like serine/threonine-protein kinase
VRVQCLDEQTVLAFVEGQLEPTMRARSEAHLDNCSHCLSLVAEMARHSGHRDITLEPEGRRVLASAERDRGAAHAATAVAALNEPRSVASGLPERIGKFVIERKLGAGGMGIVYAGRDSMLDRAVAIKVVRVADAAYQARLAREAQAMARLEHANVVRVYEVGSTADGTYIAMELVQGVTLTRWLAERRPSREVIAMFAQIGAGLAAVHRAGLVHRDFKPDNVLIDHDGHARVADFGLARLDRDESSPLASPLTETGAMMGTPGFMAPEQQLGASVDARADQYSFCIALRTALAGPRTAAGSVEDARWNEIDPNVRAAIFRGLAFDPQDRWPSLDDLLAAIAPVATTSAVAQAGSAKPRASERGRWIAVAGALAVAAAAVIYMQTRSNASAPAPQTNAVIATTSAAAPPASAAAVPAAPSVPSPAPAATPSATVVPNTPSVTAAGPTTRSVPAAAPAAPAAKTVAAAAPLQPGAAAKLSRRSPALVDVVRACVHELGYEGMDLETIDANPSAETNRITQAMLDTPDGDPRNVLAVQRAMTMRRRGNCQEAIGGWQAAARHLDKQGGAREWEARAHEGIALCALEAGDAETADDETYKGWGRDIQELYVIAGIASYMLGKDDVAHDFFGKVGVFPEPPAPARTLAARRQFLTAIGWN